MSEKSNSVKLREKVTSFFGNELIVDTARLIPRLDDAMENISKISNIADNFKLKQAWKCISENNDIEKSINVLYNYVSNQDRAFYISDAFKKIILSNSKIASSVIAYMIGEISRDEREFTQEDVILYNALSNMTDYDIKNFVYIMDEMIVSRVGVEYIDLTNCKDESDSVLLTINLCISYRLFLEETSIHKNRITYTGTHIKKTKQSYTLLTYIKKTKQLLKYD